MSEHQIVVFNLNNETYGIDSCQIQMILNCGKITGTEGMPEFMKGLISYRDQKIPVVSLSKKFGLGDADITKKSKVVVALVKGREVGFMVDEISEIVKLPEEDIEPVPELLKKLGVKYLKGAGKRGDGLIVIIDLEGILGNDEIENLKV